MVGNATSKGSARGDAPVGVKGKPTLAIQGRVFALLAEGAGFEPAIPRKGYTGFRDRPIQPLWHPSFSPLVRLYRTLAAGYVGFSVRRFLRAYAQKKPLGV